MCTFSQRIPYKNHDLVWSTGSDVVHGYLHVVRGMNRPRNTINE